jgi:hypothetical protein
MAYVDAMIEKGLVLVMSVPSAVLETRASMRN